MSEKSISKCHGSWSARASRRIAGLLFAAGYWLLMASMVTGRAPAESPTPPVTVYYFNCDSSLDNYRTLKGEFDDYWAKNGGLKFQPFRNRRDFEDIIDHHPDGIFLMSSCHFKLMTNHTDLVPVLAGVKDDGSFMTHALWSSSDAPDSIDILSGTMATPVSSEHTRVLIAEMYGNEATNILSSMNLLNVPKGMDALLAITYHAADVAICSDKDAENLITANPQLRRSLKMVREGRPHLLPIIIVPARLLEKSGHALDELIRMGDDPEGRIRLNLIGLDRFRLFTPEEASAEGLLP